ncbi:MAG: hypothetical protein JOZ17_14760 [Acetobacteraceae bacterium]|nr:hypothetical protein [Acetobacteraceae bacterium]
MINIRGIRVGPAEIYATLQGIDEIVESMAIEQQAPQEPGGTRLVLLVVLRKGTDLDGALVKRIRTQLAQRGSSALVPNVIAAVDSLPVTFSGKRSEAAARDAVNGRPARNRDALQNPGSLDQIAGHPALRAPSRSAEPMQRIEELYEGEQLEQQLQRMCEDVLRIAPINRSDDLLDLGADSLTILNLFLTFQRFSKRDDLSLESLFRTRTIDRFAALLRGRLQDLDVKESARPVPRIRPAVPEDVDALCRFLYEGFKAGRVSLSGWRRLFDYEWLEQKPHLGFVLVCREQIVGFLGTVYAHRRIRGETHVICNLSSWYVRPEYRSWGTALLAAAIRDETITYTALTPMEVTQQALAAFHFKPLFSRSMMLLPLLQAETLRRPRPLISFDPEVVRRSLNAQQQQIFDDHAATDCLQLVVRDGPEYAYIVLKRRRLDLRLRLKLLYSDILYCSSPALLARYIEPVKLAILRKQRTLALLAEERLFVAPPRCIWEPTRTMFRSPDLDAADLDRLYSELTLLRI